MKKLAALIILLTCIEIHAQNDGMFPVTVNEKIPSYSFVDMDGKAINSNDLSGKNVMLVFIRGKVTKSIWCPICQYQYLELAEMEKVENFREKFNMEIFFVLPYRTDSLQNWVNAFPKSIQTIENWKYPKDLDSLPQATQDWAVYAKEFFPETYKEFPGKSDLSLPVVFDQDQSLSKGLQIYREEWGGTTVEQNVPTIFILDENGIVRFKYFSQMTNDRPNAIYLKRYIENML